MMTPLVSEQNGSISVEFALAAPLLLFAVLAVVQTGIVMSTRVMVAQAAREGARQATTAESDAEIIAAAEAAGGGLAGDGLRVSWSAPQGWHAGCPVTVTAAYTAPDVFPALAAVFPRSLELTSASTMRLEKDR